MSKNDLRKKVDFDMFLPYIYIRKKKLEFCLKFDIFLILLFLVLLTHKCSRNMVKSVEKRPSKKVDFDIFLPYNIYIYTCIYIRINSSFALNLTFSNFLIFRVS